MVNSHALIFVPISKLDCFAQAFMTVSWTRSSALSCLPVRDTAKARRLGKVASISLLNEVPSAAMAVTPRPVPRPGWFELFRHCPGVPADPEAGQERPRPGPRHRAREDASRCPTLDPARHPLAPL